MADFKFEKSFTTARGFLTYCWLVKPDEKYNQYQITLLFKPDMEHTLSEKECQIKQVAKGTKVNTVEYMCEKLLTVKEEFQQALLESFPQRKGKFKWQPSIKTGQPVEYWKIQEDGSLTVRLKKVSSGIRKDGKPFTSIPPIFFRQNENGVMVLCTEEEKQKYDKISPESLGEVNIRIVGYDYDYIGLKLEPSAICVRHFVPFVGGMQTAEEFGFVAEEATPFTTEEPQAEATKPIGAAGDF